MAIKTKMRYAARVARLMLADWPDAMRFGRWTSYRTMPGGIAGVGWFMLVGAPVVFILQSFGAFPGPATTVGDAIWLIGFVAMGGALVLLSRRIPAKALRLEHFVLAARDAEGRYVATCSCGWVDEPQTSIERFLLSRRAHKQQARSARSSGD